MVKKITARTRRAAFLPKTKPRKTNRSHFFILLLYETRLVTPLWRIGFTIE